MWITYVHKWLAFSFLTLGLEFPHVETNIYGSVWELISANVSKQGKLNMSKRAFILFWKMKKKALWLFIFTEFTFQFQLRFQKPQ